jgi:predicted unusual protein kinase regulating ubiquinone biosynthesis (AarF/ABC1/UbiB family)
MGHFVSQKRTEARIAQRHIRTARRVRDLIVDLRGLFIKIGQMASVLANFLPEDFRRELEGLQDKVPPRKFKEIKPVLEKELGMPLDEAFIEIQDHAIAAASLGQVHRALLPDGRHVAVKVQYPQVQNLVGRDLRILRRMLKLVCFFFPRQGLMHIYREVRDTIEEELDFSHEAINLQEIARNFSEDDKVVFPEVVPEYTTHRVLTSGWIDGVKITRVHELDSLGIDRSVLAENLIHAYCKQVFHHGRYHADPHPGNILVLEDGRIALLDFGAVCTVSPCIREGMAEYLQALVTHNTDKIISSLTKMGFMADHVEPDRVEEVIAYFQRKLMQHVKLDSLQLDNIRLDPEVGFEILMDLKEMHVGIRELSEMFQVPREWILLERTIILLTGICTVLDPKLRPMNTVRPYMEQFVLGDDQDWSSFALETGKDWFVQAVGIPAELKKVLHNVSTGRLRVRFAESKEIMGMMGASAKVVGYGVLTAGFTIASSLKETAPDTNGIEHLTVLAGISGFFFFTAILSIRRRMH